MLISALIFILFVSFIPQLYIEQSNSSVLESGDEILKVGEIWDGSNFNSENFNTFLKYVSNDENSSMNNLSPLNKNISAGDILNSYAGGKKAGQYVVVRFGGLDWMPMQVSKTASGDIIVTLWLTTHEQDAWQNKTDAAHEGLYYGFVKDPTKDTDKIGLYSKFDDSNYEISYLRTVVLNNGGDYRPDYTIHEHIEQSEENVFAKFTMETVAGSVAQYIVTPNEVSWQQSGQEDGFGHDTPDYHDEEARDECWGEASPPRAWKDDKIWLPSSWEYANWDNEINFVHFPRPTGSFSVSQGIGSVATASSMAYCDAWLRSVWVCKYGYGSGQYTIGDHWEYPSDKSSTFRAVQPALHLNLSKATGWEPNFSDLVSSDPKDPDIWQEPGENEGEVTFHIKSAKGFLKLSEYSQEENPWSDKWTYLLENDIDLSAECENFCPIGGVWPIGTGKLPPEQAFTGKFYGQNHKIKYMRNADPENKWFVYTLFGICYGNCEIRGLTVDVDISGGDGVAGLVSFIAKGQTTIENVTVTGKIVGSNVTGATASGIVQSVYPTIGSVTVNMKNVYVRLDELSGDNVGGFIYSAPVSSGAQAQSYTSNISMENCAFVCPKVYGTQSVAAVINSMNGANLNLSRVYCNANISSDATAGVMVARTTNKVAGKILADEFQFEGSLKGSEATFVSVDGQAATALEMHDSLIKVLNSDGGLQNNLFYNTSTKTYSSTYDAFTAQGTYVDDRYEIKVLDGDFTSSKWCRAETVNEGRPQLRCFLATGKFFDPFDMAAWARDQS